MTPASWSEADRLAGLRLIRTPRVGPVTYAQLLTRFGSAQAALAALPDLAARGGGKPPVVPQPAAAERELAVQAGLGATVLFLGEAAYPPLLAEADGAPPVLAVKGRAELLERPAVAMVGARNASAAARKMARELAAELGRAGWLVVSGLARGIDTAAHEGSLATGTAGVIASGLDIAWPPENAALQERIGADGVLIAEQPPGTQPLARHFPTRNRIIAGLSRGTLVVEAAPRSGSLITARLAGEAGREVMAIPGSPLDPRARGCNALIREGATLVETAADVLEALTSVGGGLRQERLPFDVGRPRLEEPGEAERRALADLLGPVPVAVDELVRQSGLGAAQVAAVLLELELAGRLERHAGNRVSWG